EPGARALALGDGVSYQRCRVRETRGLSRIAGRLALEGGESGEHRNRRVFRRRQPLADTDVAACLLEQHEIGKGAADIATCPKPGHPPFLCDQANSIAGLVACI